MHNIDQAIDELGRIVGLPDLAFDGQGNLSLLFDGTMPVNIARIDEKTMELWTTLENIGTDTDTRLLKYLLASNHLGEGTGAARLGLQPGGGDFVLCERIEAAGLDAATLEARFSEFVKHAFHWNSPEARDAAAARDPGQGLTAAEENFGIRV